MINYSCPGCGGAVEPGNGREVSPGLWWISSAQYGGWFLLGEGDRAILSGQVTRGSDGQTMIRPLPEPNLEPDDDGDICCPSCGDMIPACYWPADSDICRVCERESIR